ncbi:MAG: hypothetical protein ABFD97_12760 [Syntrophobacter sp.]
MILSANRKVKFHYLGLPTDLQDEIIDGLDAQSLTTVTAAALVKDRGYSLSHTAIATYYKAVREERRLFEINQALSRVISEYADRPFEDGLRSLLNVIIAATAAGLADGTVGIKDVDIARLLKALPIANPGTSEKKEESSKPEASADGAKVLDLATIKSLREQLGL